MQARASAGSANVPACYRLAGKKAEAVRTRRKTTLPRLKPVAVWWLNGFNTKRGFYAPMETESLVKWIAQVHGIQKRPKKLFG